MNFFKKHFVKSGAGFTLVELLVVIAFIGVMIIFVINITSVNDKLRKLNEERTQAEFYLVEATEAAKLVDWSILATGDYVLDLVDNIWTATPGSQLLDNRFTRTVTLADVYRANSENGHAYGEIVESGFWDPDTRKIMVSLDWHSRTGSQQHLELTSYHYNWSQNRWVQSDWSGGPGQVDWFDGTKFFDKDNGIDVTIPGTLTLQAGFIDWTQATTTASFDTPGNFDDNDVFALNDLAYLVTENNPSAAEYYILDVSNAYSPYLLSSLNVNASITAVTVRDGYSYISTRGNNAEFQVLDVQDNYGPAVVFTYDLPGNTDADSIDANDSNAFIAQGSIIYAFDISNPLSPVLLDSLDIGSLVTQIAILSDYLYVATEDGLKELQIIDINNPANLAITSQYDLANQLKGTDIFIRGIYAYFSIQNNGYGPEFFIFNVSDPVNPVLVGQQEVGETIFSFAVIGPYALLGTQFNGQELTAFEISDPANIVPLSGFDLNGYALGMSANCALIYAATSGNLQEFFIIASNVTDCDYAASGWLESSTFDTGYDQVVYNWLSWSGNVPDNTHLQFQLASSNSQFGPWNYLGPDGTQFTYYGVNNTELINYNAHLNQRYLRYKVYLDTSEELETPTLDEVVISFSPS